MKNIFCLLVIFFCKSLFAQSDDDSVAYASPLAEFSQEWDDERFSLCNTAADAQYLSDTEKDVIYILNLVRQYPALFCKTVLLQYPEMSGDASLAKSSFFKSLVTELRKLPQQTMLQPDKLCYESALCHAVSSGKAGYVGHNRLNKACTQNKYFNGECCDYGDEDPLDIVVGLLIDKDVKTLSHRKILLNNYSKVGVSIKPHKKYRVNTVIDVH